MNDWQVVGEDSSGWTIFAHNEYQIVPNCKLVDYSKFFPFTASNHGQSIPSSNGIFESELFRCNDTSLKSLFIKTSNPIVSKERRSSEAWNGLSRIKGNTFG